MSGKEARQWVGFHTDFENALAFVTKLHASQLRKGGDTPYIAHLLAVASLVLEHGGGRDEAIAALLHDSIEDQADDYPGGAGGLRAEIAHQFGQSVLDIVEACTDADVMPKPPWQTRKEAYIGHLEQASHGALLVSCADKVHNAHAIVGDLRVHGDALWERFKGGREGSLWYYESLAKVFERRRPGPLTDELVRTVQEMKALSSQ